tara:strand:- start:3666 stop:3932 length:267 start_codon:yes stop_codon:yes gene_type:complete
MVEEEPNLITSSKSQQVVVDGYPFSIEIYRLEDQSEWSLEVVDFENNSHVWDDLFKSDKEARNAAITELESEGALSFMRGNSVIPFKN